MGFWSILMLLIKYGPTIFQFLKAAIELIRWLRDNDDEALRMAYEPVAVKPKLEEMAKRCKKTRDSSELQAYVDSLRARKAEVERRKAGG